MLIRWLEKATWTTPDIANTAPGTGGVLSPQQAREFLRVVIDESVLLKEANNQTSASPKFEVPRISFGNRILRPGVEATRLVQADRVKPLTGLVTLSTNLFKGEIPVSDELFEDNIERDSLADTIMVMIAEAVGRDCEEYAIKNDLDRDGSDGADEAPLGQFDGMIKQLQTGLPAAHKIDGSGMTSYDQMFRNAISALPARYRRDPTALRFYVPVKHNDGYQSELAGRGTPLGDTNVTENLRMKLAFRGIPVVPIPLMTGVSTISGSEIDYDQFAILTHPQNLYVGWHRRIRVERFRDPRDAATSFLPTLRFDVKYADPSFGVLVSGLELGSA
jgi:HK97 family phage major capsid protein